MNRFQDIFRDRSRIITILLLLWIALVIFRLLSLQIISPDRWHNAAINQHTSKIKIASQRGRIVDRNGKDLAVSVPAASIYVRPKEVENPEQVKLQMASILKISEEEISNKLSSSSPFIWVKRQVPEYLADELEKLDLNGVGSITEARRYFPYANSSSVLLGKVGIDGNGLAGIEASFENTLNPEQLEIQVFKDAKGKIIFPKNFNQESVIGDDIKLTIDAELQNFAHKELNKIIKDHKAKNAIALMIDPDNGEILIMAQAPSENFNVERIKSRKAFFNITAQGSYEPGSTMKPMVAALALDEGVVKIDQVINTENGKFKFGGRLVNDVHGSDKLSVKDIIVQSSNIGMTKIAIELGKEKLYAGLKKFGFGKSTNLPVAGEASGIFRNVKNWSTIDLATHSFGQGIAVTALQLVRAFSVLVNGGYLPELSIVKTDKVKNFKGDKLISDQTSEEIREALIAVVQEEEGTGNNAKIKGLQVGGKTGTAQKAREDGRGYQKGAYMASFIGFADGESIGINKKVVLLILVDEPRGKSIYGGTVAAPAFANIIKYVFMAEINRQTVL